MIVPATQMAIGFRGPVLPKFIHSRELEVSKVFALATKVIPWIEKLERFVRPRWLWLTVSPMPNLIGLAVIGLALVIMLPLPFSNLPPALALLCLSIGLLERDGVLIAFGIIVTVVALAVGIFMAAVALQTLIPALVGYL